MASPTPIKLPGQDGGDGQRPRRPRSMGFIGTVPFSTEQTAEAFQAFTLIHQQMVLKAQQVREEERLRQLKAQTEAKIGAGRSYRAYLENGRRKRAEAATAIQSMVRMRAARQEFLAQREAAITLQSQIRGFLARREYERQQDAALTLQSAVRGMEARKEFDRLVQERDDAFRVLDLHINTETAKWGGIETRASTALPYDGLLGAIATGASAGALGAMGEIQTNKDWAGYAGKLTVIKARFDAVISDLKQRLENDKVFVLEIRKLSKTLKLQDLTNPNDIANLAGKLGVSNVAKSWGTLVTLVSAVKQDVGEFYTSVGEIEKFYKPPEVTAKPKKKFNREDPNSWQMNALQWHARVSKMKTTVEALPDADSVLGKLKTGGLSGRTITKGSVMKTDFVMHEHIGSGNKGIGFCYLHEDDDTVTPWVLDYATGRDGNTYEWGSGKRDGDPFVAVAAKKTV